MFRDRTEAGQRLASALGHYADRQDGLVLAIPRGGVVVGREISLALRLPLDVLLTRKIGAADNPELAIGALSETGHLHLNEELLASHPSLMSMTDEQRREQEEEIARRRRLYRGGRELPSLAGRLIMLVDDGVATGATYLASVQALKAAGAARLVAAIPVGPAETAGLIAQHVDECIMLECPQPFYAVGQHYQDFHQVDDAEVIRCLSTAWKPVARTSP